MNNKIKLNENNMNDFDIQFGVLIRYNGNDSEIVIPSNVTSINYNAFSNCFELKSVTIPNTVTKIGNAAFSGCINLTNIVIHSTTLTIGDFAFADCSSLREIIIEGKLTKIKPTAFYNCRDLLIICETENTYKTLNKYIKNNSEITIIHKNSQEQEFDLDDVEIEESLKEARTQSALKSNGIYSVMNNEWIKEPVLADIPEINQEEFDKEFSKWEDRYFEIVESPTVEKIEDFIEDIYDLRKTSIANEGEYGIGNLVFKECRNLEYLDTLKDLKNEIKSKEMSLESLNENLSDFEIKDGVLINYKGKDKKAIIPSNVKRIGPCAFEYHSNLESIIIPDNVISIGMYAFYYCKSLASITIPSSVITIEHFAFSNCTSLKEVIIKGKLFNVAADIFGICKDLLVICEDVDTYKLLKKSTEDNSEVTVINPNSKDKEFDLDDVEIEESIINESKQDKENLKNWLYQYGNADMTIKQRILEPLIDYFFEHKNEFKSPEKDLYYWINKSTQKEFINFIIEQRTDNEAKKEEKKKASEGSKLVYSDKDWKVYHITSYEAAKKYGANTKWCITGSKRWTTNGNGESFWDSYHIEKNVDFYFFITKDEKYALSIYPDGHCEIFNSKDVKVPFIPNAPKVDEIKVKYTVKNTDRRTKLIQMIINNELPWEVESELFRKVLEENISDDEFLFFNNAEDFCKFISDNYNRLSSDAKEKLQGETKEEKCNPNNFKDSKFFFVSTMWSDWGDNSYNFMEFSDYSELLMALNNTVGVYHWEDEEIDDFFINQPEGTPRADIFAVMCYNELPSNFKFNEDLKESLKEDISDDFIISGNTFTKYKGTSKEVIIPDGITNIVSEAFWNNRYVESITMSDSVVVIEDRAFYGCTNLKSIRLSNNLSIIGKAAFYNCTSLTEVELPKSLRTLGDGAFAYSGITHINIPEKITTIHPVVFSECKNLEEIEIPSTCKTIGIRAFSFCEKLKKVILNEGLKNIKSGAFSNCSSLEEITLPKSLEEIETGTFWDSDKLNTVIRLGNCPLAVDTFVISYDKLDNRDLTIYTDSRVNISYMLQQKCSIAPITEENQELELDDIEVTENLNKQLTEGTNNFKFTEIFPTYYLHSYDKYIAKEEFINEITEKYREENETEDDLSDDDIIDILYGGDNTDEFEDSLADWVFDKLGDGYVEEEDLQYTCEEAVDWLKDKIEKLDLELVPLDGDSEDLVLDEPFFDLAQTIKLEPGYYDGAEIYFNMSNEKRTIGRLAEMFGYEVVVDSLLNIFNEFEKEFPIFKVHRGTLAMPEEKDFDLDDIEIED